MVLRQDEIQPPCSGNVGALQPSVSGQRRVLGVFRGNRRKMEVAGTTNNDLITTFIVDEIYSKH